MSKDNLSPEGELMCRIIEQWGNAVAMPKMEGWIREYGDNRVATAKLSNLSHDALFGLYNDVKQAIGELGYNTFIHSKEVEEYRAFLRNDLYKHRLDWFEQKYPKGLHYTDDDGMTYGINIITKQFLAEADAAYHPVIKWVVTIDYTKIYIAKRLGPKPLHNDQLGASEIRGTGWFQESDGTFFWQESGFIPVLPKEYSSLSLLIEQP